MEKTEGMLGSAYSARSQGLDDSVLRVLIDVPENCLRLSCGRVIRFRRERSAAFLTLLVVAKSRNEGVTHAMLENCGHKGNRASQGQAALCRVRAGRIVQDVKNVLDILGRAITIVSEPRKMTVGPWQLRHGFDVIFMVESPPPPPLIREVGFCFGEIPLLAAGQDVARLDELLALLEALLKVDAFAFSGYYENALAHLSEQRTSMFLPSRQMRWLLALKSARLQQELGNSKMAWQILRGIAVSADAEYVPGLLPAIGVLLSRMEEENGCKIMAAGIEPLLRKGGVDLEAWCEQHQVFAMQAVMDARRAVFEGVSLDKSLLNKLLRHFESALFGALLRWNPQRIQGLVRRLAWCLHLLLESNVVSVRQVMQWHALASDYGEELDVSVSGNDFAYLGQFWLDNVVGIRKEGEKDGRLMARLVVADLAPRCESFYRCGIDWVRNSGNQWALGLCLLNYLRFSRNIGDFSKASEECKQQLFELLQGNPKICQRLQDVGLLKHLPSGFAKILR